MKSDPELLLIWNWCWAHQVHLITKRQVAVHCAVVSLDFSEMALQRSDHFIHHGIDSSIIRVQLAQIPRDPDPHDLEVTAGGALRTFCDSWRNDAMSSDLETMLLASFELGEACMAPSVQRQFGTACLQDLSVAGGAASRHARSTG